MGDAFDMVLTIGTAGAAGWLYANWKNVGAEVGILAGELAWMLASLAVIIMLVNEWIDTGEDARDTMARIEGALVWAGTAIPIGARRLGRRRGALESGDYDETEDGNTDDDDDDATTGSSERAA